MEEEVVIVIGRKSLNRDSSETEERVIKIKLNGEGPLSDLLRRAADVIDGTPQE